MITRDFSFLLDADGAIHLEPHLPISVGPCTIFGLPATAVHELTLICGAGATHAPKSTGCVRDLDADRIAFDGGALGFGGIELDWDVEDSALHDLRGAAPHQRARQRSSRGPGATQRAAAAGPAARHARGAAHARSR